MPRISKKNITEDDAHILQETSINLHYPGTILKDMKVMIDLLQSQDIELTKSTSYFPLKYLPFINEKLSTPIRIDLKRPNKKSFPNIMGLYLLLRTIGLLQIRQTDNKKYAQIDQQVLNFWSKLNTTEAYFTLFESWLVRANPKSVLDEYHSPYELLLTSCFDFWTGIPKQGLKINKDQFETLKYIPDLYNVSLLEQFGLIDVVHGEPEKGKGWKIEKIKRNEYGDAIFRHLYEKLIDTKAYSNFCLFNLREWKHLIRFGQLQKYFRPYFPKWESNLSLPDLDFRLGTHIFKIIWGNVWRVIAIHSELNFEDFSQAILSAFGFDNDHLYAYYFQDRFGNSNTINHPRTDDPPLTDEVKIGKVPLEIGSSMKFVYDFGDYWEFEIKLQEIKETDIVHQYPKILERHGKAPKQYHSWDDDDDFY